MKQRDDFIHRLTVFLAKRDGIDKVVKTLQYVSRLANVRLQKRNPELAQKVLLFSGHCGLARKAFRLGRFLSGFDSLRNNKHSGLVMTALNIVGHSGDMVYFLFDHLCWLSKHGILDPKYSAKFSHISAAGEIFLYVSFIIVDVILIQSEQQRKVQLEAQHSHQWRLREKLQNQISQGKMSRYSPFASSALTELQGSSIARHSPTKSPKPRHRFTIGNSSDEERSARSRQASDGEKVRDEDKLKPYDEEIERVSAFIQEIQWRTLLRVLGIAANAADLVIAVADVQPNPFCNHEIVYAISGLVSAWSGWFRNWPFPN